MGMHAVVADISIWEISGLCGAGLYAVSYLLSAYDRLPSQSPVYYLSKLTAAVLVMLSLTQSFNLASVVIQAFFIVISVIGICRHVTTRRRLLALGRSVQAVSGRPRAMSGQGGGDRQGCDFAAGVIEMLDARPEAPGASGLTGRLRQKS